MEATIKLLDPWWRELRGVLEAVSTGEDHVGTWELRVLLPRQSKYTPQQWGRRSRATSSDSEKLQRVREALELLAVIRAIDEAVWTRILVQRCGVGGWDMPMWTDDARVLPVLRLQPYHVDTIVDSLEVLEQCDYLMAPLPDETKLSADFCKTKRELMVIAKAMKRPLPLVAYRVSLSNWLSPNTQLSAAESTQMWGKLSAIVREPSPAGEMQWQLTSLDLYLLRSVVTFDTSLALLEMGKNHVRVDELWIDLLDRAGDELTASGLAAVLTKLFQGPSPPRHLRVDCAHASVNRLHQLAQVLQATTAPVVLTFERFGLGHARGVPDRVALFTLLGVCLRQHCIRSLTLDVPEFSGADISTMAAAFTNGERSTNLALLKLTTDCRRESWGVVEKMLHLVGKHLESLEISVNGDALSEKAPKAILSLCPRLQHATLHRLRLGKRSPLVAHLREPASRLRSLALPRLQAPLSAVGELSRTLADCAAHPSGLQSLHLDLSDIPNVCDETVSGLSAALRENTSLHSLTLTLDGDAAAALSDPVHDDFYHLHNKKLAQPLSLRCKLAFLSVASSPKLSQLPLALIFQFAGAQSRRRVSIREPRSAWAREEADYATLHDRVDFVSLQLADLDVFALDQTTDERWEELQCLREGLELLALAVHYDKRAWRFFHDQKWAAQFEAAFPFELDHPNVQAHWQLCFHDSTRGGSDSQTALRAGVDMLTRMPQGVLSAEYHKAMRKLRQLVGAAWDDAYRVPVSLAFAAPDIDEDATQWVSVIYELVRSLNDPTGCSSESLVLGPITLSLDKLPMIDFTNHLALTMFNAYAHLPELTLALAFNDTASIAPTINDAVGICPVDTEPDARFVDTLVLRGSSGAKQFAGWCSAVARARSLGGLTLDSAFTDKTPGVRHAQWRWLGYALSNRHWTTSVRHLKIKEEFLTRVDVEQLVARRYEATAADPPDCALDDHPQAVQLATKALVCLSSGDIEPLERLGFTYADEFLVVDDDEDGEWMTVLVPG